mgnify:CR=1 FL=1
MRGQTQKYPSNSHFILRGFLRGVQQKNLKYLSISRDIFKGVFIGVFAKNTTMAVSTMMAFLRFQIYSRRHRRFSHNPVDQAQSLASSADCSHGY